MYYKSYKINLGENIIEINLETLMIILSKMFGKKIINADYRTQQLKGGTVGDVKLVTGIAEADNGEKLPYKVVLKIQKKWERPGDPNSWRREYDLYMSELDSLFDDSLRWAKCYHAEMDKNETETQLWLEYIDGISGNDLTLEMLEKASEEMGRFQGRLYKQSPPILQDISCLTVFDGVKGYYMYCRENVFNFINSEDCKIPKHLRQLLTDNDKNAETIFANIEKFPAVLCHRDFWIENIFYTNGKIRLIDWDSLGWGYLTETIAQLIIDDTDAEKIEEYYQKLVPAYFKGISEYMDISAIKNFYILELLIIKFIGYRLIYRYIYSDSEEIKNQQIIALQKLYDIKTKR